MSGVDWRRWGKSVMLAVVMVLLPVTQGAVLMYGWASSTVVAVDAVSRVILGAGSQGVTDLQVRDVEDLYGYQPELHFDPSIVRAERVDPGPVMARHWLLCNMVHNARGSSPSLWPRGIPRHPGGSGRLAQVTWQGVASGTGDLTLVDVRPTMPEGSADPRADGARPGCGASRVRHPKAVLPHCRYVTGQGPATMTAESH